MVGGAISGYWAIGSVESAMTPRSVMTMLITPAKIGRSMKKCGKFIAIRVALEPRSFSGWGWSGASFGVRPAGGRLFRHRRDFHSGLQQLQTSGDNFLAVFQSAFYNTFSFEKAASLKVSPFDGTVGFHHEGVFPALLLADYLVGNKRRPVMSRAGNAHGKEAARSDAG